MGNYKKIKINLKSLLSATVIVCLALIFVIFGRLIKANSGVASLVSALKAEEVSNEGGSPDGNMGGPLADSMVGEELSANQMIIDFSADDEAENFDYATIQENSVIGSTNPSILNQFSHIRKEIATYVVRSGDIPEKIAALFGINSRTLLWANGLRDGDLIKPGDKLTILPINGIKHRLQKGDSLVALAKKYQADEEEIRQFNLISSDDELAIGQDIIIPDGEMPVISKPKAKTKVPILATPPASLQISSSWLIQPTTGFNWGRLHGYNGIDIANQCGTPIYAAADGVVTLSDIVGWNGGYGKNVRLKHDNGVITLYAHLSESLVGAGQRVAQGQLIALMGTTGRSTGCHVHFEVRGAKNPFARSRK